MVESQKIVQARSHLKGLAAHILEEVIKADMSMHEVQIDAWKKFGEFRPQGELINKDIHLGFAEKNYLCLNEVRLSFCIKSIPMTFFHRIKLAFYVLKGKNRLSLYNPVVFDLCSKSDIDAISMEILVKRFENGTIQANYKPVDLVTSELFLKS